MSSSQQFKIGMLRDGAARMTCRDAHCANEREGWATVLDPQNPRHAKAAQLIRQDSGRRYVEIRSEEALDYNVQAHATRLGLTANPETLHTLLANTPPGLVVFIFPPGQQCFRRHLDREVVFVHQARTTLVHANPRDFNEHMNIEADRINRIRQRG